VRPPTLALTVTLAVLAAPACGGDGGDDDGAAEPEPAPSGPATVTTAITLNGDETAGQIALVPTDLAKGKSVRLRKTESDGTLAFRDVDPGEYEVSADVAWQIAPPEPGQDVGPARNRPCRADGYVVQNVFLEVGNYFVSAGATSEEPIEVGPGERTTVIVDYECRF